MKYHQKTKHGRSKPNPMAIRHQVHPENMDKVVPGILNGRSADRANTPSKNALSVADLQNLAEAAVNIWRARQRIVSAATLKEASPEMKNVLRRLDSALERLKAIHLTLEDHTGQPFVQGMALNVISSQPNSDLTTDRICETLKPTVFFREEFVQAGDVIIEGPPSENRKVEENGKGLPT
jgi:hypothetical protein